MELNKIYQRNVLDIPWPMEDNSVDCCVTSPPYWGLRDYGVEGQLGLEKNPEEYINKMVAVFEEVRRVLKPEGTLWLNIGDSYAGNGGAYGSEKSTLQGRQPGDVEFGAAKRFKKKGELKPKDLVGIPWMLAFALRSAGWYLRQDIIWHKPNPMPESVSDRCTKAHEYIFLLSKSPKYYFDKEAIKEAASNNTHERQSRASIGQKSIPDEKKNGIRPRKAQKAPTGWDMGPGNHDKKTGRYDNGVGWNTASKNSPKDDRVRPTRIKNNESFDLAMKQMPDTRNKRSVWTVTPHAFKEAHFATFPEKLITPCILAGCPKDGIVFDPFIGAGTTGIVAMSHGRKFIGFELNPEYIKIANKRLKQKFGMFFNTTP